MIKIEDGKELEFVKNIIDSLDKLLYGDIDTLNHLRDKLRQFITHTTKLDEINKKDYLKKLPDPLEPDNYTADALDTTEEDALISEGEDCIMVSEKLRSLADRVVKELQKIKEDSDYQITDKQEHETPLQKPSQQSKVPAKDIKSEKKYPHRFSSETRWGNIAIQFINENEVIIRSPKDRIGTKFKYDEMGFADGRSGQRNLDWLLLLLLAKHDGEVSSKEIKAVLNEYNKDTKSFAKRAHKSSLSKQLQSYFRIDFDPFFPYRNSPEKKGNSSKVKFILSLSPQFTRSSSYSEDEDKIEKEIIDDSNANEDDDQDDY
jgi:hypothetical protein